MLRIQQDNPTRPEVQQLLAEHLEEMRKHSPPESIHALDVSGLLTPEITFWTITLDDQLAGCGALRELDPQHGEIKSMRTSQHFRRRGLARVMLEHILTEANTRNYGRLSLETGAQPGFEPARRMYAAHGFTICPPFGNYQADPNSVFMTRELSIETGG